MTEPFDASKSYCGSGQGKHVVFDIGNVLVHTNFSDFLKKLSRELNITIEEAEYFMNRTQKLHDLGCTKMADELRDHFKIRSPIIIEELIGAWKNVIKPNYQVLTRLDNLVKNNNLQIALLSNIGLEHSEQIIGLIGRIPAQNYWYDSSFASAIKHFSCLVGARKPSLLYYQSFLQLYPQFKGCAYIDDLQENLEASQQFGFQTYRFSLEEFDKWNFEFKMKGLEDFILGVK